MPKKIYLPHPTEGRVDLNRAAEILGISRNTVYQRLDTLGWKKSEMFTRQPLPRNKRRRAKMESKTEPETESGLSYRQPKKDYSVEDEMKRRVRRMMGE